MPSDNAFISMWPAATFQGLLIVSRSENSVTGGFFFFQSILINVVMKSKFCFLSKL